MTKQKLTPTQLADLLTNLPPGATIELKKTPQGELIVDGQAKTKQQLIDESFPHLVGRGISLTQASKKYGVPRGTIQRWVYTQCYVHFVDEDAYPQLADEAEIALCAKIYHQRKKNGLTGVPYFDEHDRLVEEVKHPDRSRQNR